MKTILTAAMMLAATALSAPASAQTTVGNSATPRTFLDTASNLTFVLDQGFGTAGRLDSFSFFAGQSGDVTPLVFSRDDTSGQIVFTLTGIGTTRNVRPGTFTFDFGLTDGSDLTDASSYFGFRTVSLGVVSFDYQSSTLPGAFAKQFTNTAVGGTLSFDPGSRAENTGNGLNFRAYSINATAGAVPEPATWAMLLVGFGGMGAALRYRRRATRIASA